MASVVVRGGEMTDLGLTLVFLPAPAVSGCRPGRLTAHLPLLPGITAEALLQELRQAGVGRPATTPTAAYTYLPVLPQQGLLCQAGEGA